MAKAHEGRYGTWYSDNDTGWYKEHQQSNVLYIYRYLSDPSNSKHPTNSKYDFTWTLNAIAGLCGNIEYECHFRPGLQEVGGSGYGLIQWTSGMIHKNWCQDVGAIYGIGKDDYANIEASLAHIVHEVHQDIQGIKDDGTKDDTRNYGSRWSFRDEYKLSYKGFAESKKPPAELAEAFLWERERSAIVCYGFHSNSSVTPPHNGKKRNYCSKASYDDSCKNNCVGYKGCYRNHFSEAQTQQQAAKNRANTKKKRGDAATKWYNFLVEKTFRGRPDYKIYGENTNEDYLNLYKKSYWRSDDHGGLNYNTAIENWTNAQGADSQGRTWDSLVDGPNGKKVTPKSLIKGTYTTLPNCTSWVWGRVYEILGEEPFDFSGIDAGGWWNRAQTDAAKAAGYRTSDTPALGAIMCWQDKDNPSSMGHVAVVEKIFENGNITFSESGYKTWSFTDTGFWNLQKNTTPTSWYNVARHNYVFKGYIHLPITTIILPEIEYFELVGDPSTESANFKIKIKTNGSKLDNVFYFLNGNNNNLLPLSLAATDEEQKFTINNLVPNTAYTITIKIQEPSGNVLSETVSFITKQDYPDPIKSISIYTDSKHHENSVFNIEIEPPDYWGYWKDKARNDYGYRVFLVDNCLLSDYYDMKNENIQNFFKEKPADYLIGHAHNFQVGVSTWVTDHRITDAEEQKVFALEGHKEYPICSNSICLKELDEMSDNYYLLTKNILSKPVINRLQAYDRKTGKPLNVFILKDL